MSVFRKSFCANDNANGEETACKEQARQVCGSCHLVQYCSKACQTKHWAKHKLDCKSPLSKKTWRTRWEIDRRTPAFISNSSEPAVFGVKKYLWGNMPAIDVCCLSSNEGMLWDKDLRLLFAASGDLRNVVQTVAGLPKEFAQRCEVHINDIEEDVVVRNVILLLTALSFDKNSAAEAMLHLWYSALIPRWVLSSLETKVLPLIKDVCNKTRDKPDHTLLGKTWQLGTCELRVVFTKRQWGRLLHHLQVPFGLDGTKALAVRKTTTSAPTRIDYVDRSWCCQPPLWRVARQKFREDGILLPFGASRADFDTPNPTLFQTADSWPMMDSADPLAGWPIDAPSKMAKPAKNDIYGGLHRHVGGILQEFCERVAALKIYFHATCFNAKDLPDKLHWSPNSRNSFDRIEVSNIVDRWCLGLPLTLAIFGPLLKPLNQNPYATLITLFLNAVVEVSCEESDQVNIREREIKRALRFLPKSTRACDTCMYSMDHIRFASALDFFKDFKRLFDKYMQQHNLAEIREVVGIVPKAKNTVIDPWPLQLKRNASQEEFEAVMASCWTGCERYMEWQRDGAPKLTG